MKPIIKNTFAFLGVIFLTYGIYNFVQRERLTEKYWKNHFRLIKNFNETSKIKIASQFIGGINPEVETFVTSNRVENISFIPYKSPVELGQLIADSDILLMFKIDLYPNSFPTKFFDYIYFIKMYVVSNYYIFIYVFSVCYINCFPTNYLSACINYFTVGSC